MFIRSKVVKGATYYQAVQGYRHPLTRKVMHRTVVSLGRHPSPQACIAATKTAIGRLRRKLRLREPFEQRFLNDATATHLRREAGAATELRRRIDQLTQQLARLGEVRAALSVDTTDPAAR